MEPEEILRTIGIVVAVGLVAMPLADLLRVPSMVLLVAGGILVGPEAFDWIEVPLGSEGAQLLLTFGVALILFHGGLGISLRVIQRTAIGLGMLVLPGVLLTAFLLAPVIGWQFDVRFEIALMCGAVLAATDPAILIPLFDRLGLRPKVAQTVIAESGFNDPTGTVLSLALAAMVVSGDASFGTPSREFVEEVVIGAALGLVAGLALAFMVSARRSAVWSEAPAAVILALVAIAYFAAGELGGSPYLAAFVMGLVVGNADQVRVGRNHDHFHLLDTFTTQVVQIAVIGIFVVLGVNLSLDLLWDDLLPGLIVMAAFLLLVRPIVVVVCLLPDRRARWTREEVAFLAWCRETGVVPAAIASLLVADAVEGAEIAQTLVAFAVVTTLLLQATTAGWVANRLGLIERPDL